MANLLKTSVDDEGLTQLIIREGRNCTPDQFVREFTVNSIEAVQRTGQPGRVVVDYDHQVFKECQIYKICFIDNGDGMTPEEMRNHLNRISSTGQTTNVYQNYGMGSKVAAFTRNHYGMQYQSWKNGEGHQVTIRYDEKEMCYGIPEVGIEGVKDPWAPKLNDEAKPEMIGEHGTTVTLFGMDFDDNTMNPPKNVLGGKENWLIRYLNTRFFRVPKDVEIFARVGYYRDPKNKKHNYLRKVVGQKEVLDKNAEESGVVNLTDAKAHWWILKEGRQGHSRELVQAHTALLNQDELFQIGTGRSHRLQGFGVIFGKENVVIYIEPNPKKGYVQSGSRTNLVQHDGSPLPWDRWEDEFQKNSPAEIQAYIKQKMNELTNSSNTESIKERLKKIVNFLKITRYKRSKSGTLYGDPDSEISSDTGHLKQGPETGKSKKDQSSGITSGKIQDLLLSNIDLSGEPVEAADVLDCPEFKWVSLEDQSRSTNDEYEDRAAMFHPKNNMIVGNWNFQGYQDVMEIFSKDFKGNENAENLIRSKVQEAFEMQLMETVIMALKLENRPTWNSDQFNDLVSPEALTAAVLGRYHLSTWIKRHIGNDLKKMYRPDES